MARILHADSLSRQLKRDNRDHFTPQGNEGAGIGRKNLAGFLVDEAENPHLRQFVLPSPVPDCRVLRRLAVAWLRRLQ